MKVLLVLLALVPQGTYHSEKEFMAKKKYTVAQACKFYKAQDCEVRKNPKIEYCLSDGGYTEGACDPWELWGVKDK